MSMKQLADEAIAHVNAQMATHADSRCATDDEVRMAAMACRIEEARYQAYKARLLEEIEAVEWVGFEIGQTSATHIALVEVVQVLDATEEQAKAYQPPSREEPK